MTPCKATLFACFVCFVVNLPAQVDLRWDSQLERPSSYAALAFRGETIRLMPRLVRGSIPADTAGAAATFHWQTNGMGQAWWVKPASVSTSEPGRVAAVFAPTNDFGAARYTWFVRLDGDGGASYRAFGTLAMRDSPGYSPTAAPPAGQAWVSPDELHAVSNALAAAIQEAGSGDANAVRAEFLATNVQVQASLAIRPDAAAVAGMIAAADISADEALRLIQSDSNAWISTS